MGQTFFPDNIPDLAIATTTAVTMATTYQGRPTRITVGGQQYRYQSAVTINFATTGVNALDTGTIAANTLYYIYAVVVAGTPRLVASTSGSGPSGYSAYKEIARCRTLSTAATLAAIGNRDDGAARKPNELVESVTSYTIGADTTPPTPGAGAAYYRRTFRDGDFALVRWEYSQTAAGTAGSGSYRLPMLATTTIDGSRIGVASASGYARVMSSNGFFNNASTYLTIVAYGLGGTNYILGLVGNEIISPSAGFGSTGGALSGLGTTVFCLEARIPVIEWKDLYT